MDEYVVEAVQRELAHGDVGVSVRRCEEVDLTGRSFGWRRSWRWSGQAEGCLGGWGRHELEKHFSAT